MKLRIRLFRWVTGRLQPGQTLPWWARTIRLYLFPLDVIGCKFYDPILDVYTIRGTQFSGAFFDAFAGDSSAVYQFTRIAGSGIVTVKRYRLPLDPDSLAELQQRVLSFHHSNG